MELLKKLSETPGAPGREERVRDLIRGEVEGHCDRVYVDPMGNLVCVKRATRDDGHITDANGESRPPRVMLACHMDEIAFYVRSVDARGFIRVQQLGGFDIRNLYARRVLIQGRDDIVGTMNPSGRPIHLATADDKKKTPRIIDLVVDTGRTREELETLVRPGDPVTLVQTFEEVGDCVTGKALDNRVACWTGIRVLQSISETSYDVHVVFTVQEEVGVRGATTASHRVAPDIGIAIDTTLAVDVPGIPDEEQVTALGGGVAIKIMDSYSISDARLVDRFAAIAEEREIEHQFEILPLGGTDAGAVQRARMGCRAITLSVPTRYIHTVTETIRPSDLRATLDLLLAFLEDRPEPGEQSGV